MARLPRACSRPERGRGSWASSTTGIDAVSFDRVGAGGEDRLRALGQGGQAGTGAGQGKNHMVVDAVIDKTVAGIIGSAAGAAGQRCMAGSVVVLVTRSSTSAWCPPCAKPRKIRVGDGLDEDTELGPWCRSRASGSWT